MSRQSLRTTIAILKAQQEATVDGILVIGHDGHILSYNRRFLEIWGIPESVATSADDNDLLGYAAELVDDWDAFIELVNYLYANPDEVRTDDPVHLKDGRVLARTSVPVKTEGKHTGRAWYFRDVTEAKRAERLQSALFRIAQLSRESEDLDHFYAAVHHTIGELMDATNFYIAEVDAKRNVVNFPYFVDQFDPQPRDLPIGHGLTAYVLRTGRALFATPEVFEDLHARGEVTAVGAPSVDWIGVPLKSGDETWGVIGVQSYDNSVRYQQRDVDILEFVAQHVASAIDQKRREDAVRVSERRYRQMFENNRAVQLLLDPTSGEIVDANMAACDFYGYTYDELCSMRIWDINVLGEESVRTEMANAAAQQRSYFVFRHRRSTGEIRDVEVHSGPIDVGERRLLYSIIHDITERKHAEERLATSNAQRKAVLDAATRVSIIASDPDGTITVFNAGAERMLGYTADEMIGKRTLLDLHDPLELEEHGAGLEREFRRAIGGFDVLAMRAAIFGLEEREWTFVRKNGDTATVHVAVTAIRGEDASITGFLHVATDVTARKHAEEMLRKQSAAMQASMDGMGILNERLDFTYANEALARLFGFNDAYDIVGKNLCDLYEPPEQVRFVTIIMPQVLQRGRWRGEASGQRRDGAQFPQEISLTLLDVAPSRSVAPARNVAPATSPAGAAGGGGATHGFVCVVRDITERTYAEEQIKHLAYHDALTGLPNRLLFKDRVTVALSHAQRDNSRLAVLFLDLDRFKVINDSLGHNIGDQLLQAVASRVQSCVRDSDTLARLGGDEFTLLLPGLVRSDDAAPIADKILDAVRQPFHIEGREFYITTSIGISLYPEDGSDAESLIKNADTAMYQAKEQGRDNYQLFNAYVNARALQRITIEHGLRRALAAGELEVHYQPIYDFRSGRISGMEALLRWTHPELGPIPPGVFIPLAESTGAMVPIGAWVLRTACAQVKAWHEAGFRSLSLAVNLSVTQLHQGDLVERVRQILDETQLPPRLLELEITESSAMLSPETSIRTLYDLKKLGIRISLDDFGTGHSSLSYLKRFPIDTLKIDQSFVSDINSDPDTAAIVTAIIAMAHSLRLKVIAEGVELTEQANFLRRYGCDQMQGYLVKPPVPASEFVTILEQPA
jgi:diguanylate cyclase (GGDEF)-like protein/PAS domain S-box-containing protein